MHLCYNICMFLSILIIVIMIYNMERNMWKSNRKIKNGPLRRKSQLKKVKAVICFVLILTAVLLSTGCDMINNLEVKTGLKNRDFEYIKQGKIQKIVIQNTRDRGFRFVVTDEKAIQDLYNILSSAKHANEKSSLEPDYIFEMYESANVVHKFNYIAGLDKKDGGNLYSDNNIYIVSDRIDNDIIKSLWNIRKPKDFQEIYYGSIIKYLDEYDEEFKTATGKSNPSIGININDDVDVSKFILSTDIEDFKNELQDKGINATLMNASDDGSKYDIVMTMKTAGYKSTLYKSSATFYSNIDKSEKKLYSEYQIVNSIWQFNMYNDSTKPKDF